MKLLVKLAWRNIFRNKRRTYITAVAIGIGLASLIFVDAIFIGMADNMIRTATGSFLGEAQIHRDGFRENMTVEKTIENLAGTVARLEKEDVVERFTIRTMTFAMISSPLTVAAVSMVGVDPATEIHLSQIDEALIEGTYFTGGGERDILIGSKLAEILEVAIGDRVVLTAAQAHTGDLAQELFRVSGIYHFNIGDMDRAMAFVRLAKSQELLNLSGEAHEIVIKFKESGYARDRAAPFWAAYSASGNEAIGWPVLLPQLEAAFALSDFSTFITGLILFGVVALGIINTLFMSLHERMFEFGIFRAVGTRPAAIGGMVVLEAASLAVISIAFGMLFGAAVTSIVARTGIDYTGIEFAGVTFRERLYPALELSQFIYYPFWVFVLTTFIGLYPAVHAARLVPARAMRKSF